MLFWTLTAALVAVIALLFALALWRGGADAAALPDAAKDLGLYRDQLKGVEADLARGVITPEEGERLRVEISRRLLEADRAAKDGQAGSRAPQGATVAVAVTMLALLGGSVWIYQWLGAPGFADQPLSARMAESNAAYDARPSQADAEATAAEIRGPLPTPDPQYAELMAKLRQAVTDRPDDTVGHDLLARNEALLGNFHEAWVTQQKLIALKGDAATADDLAMQAEYMIGATGGVITPEIEAVLEDTLRKDPGNGTALYYMGLMMAQLNRPDRTFDIWSALLERGPEYAPWIAPIRRTINELAWFAGQEDYVAPVAQAVGPTAADLAAAAGLAPEARVAVLDASTQALMSKMAMSGGTADEWARLIRALKLLGDDQRADAIWAEAQQVFAERPVDLAMIAAAATGEETAPALAGPTAEDMAAAASLSAEEQSSFIDSMVARLSDRLETEGGSGAEWAQLFNALGTLGRIDEAKEKWAAAQIALADKPGDLAQARAAAQAAGAVE
ncbi:c-type cytochrome biogenesis protein CcmI [Phaeovulum sp.]|uniref:c-type cytochrome biogenesis protein CcmI n=1 Tax=Phaeovulum sp. TaxID=2934796 RepID=UPI003567FB3B